MHAWYFLFKSSFVLKCNVNPSMSINDCDKMKDSSAALLVPSAVPTQCQD